MYPLRALRTRYRMGFSFSSTCSTESSLKQSDHSKQGKPYGSWVQYTNFPQNPAWPLLDSKAAQLGLRGPEQVAQTGRKPIQARNRARLETEGKASRASVGQLISKLT